MSDSSTGVIAGIDCHLDQHVVAVLDPLGRLVGTRSFPANSKGYAEVWSWMSSFGTLITVGVESTGAYGAALTRHLRSRGARVIEVNQPHAHTAARRGKDDHIDAEAAARKVLSGEATAAAKDATGIVESIRQLTVARSGAVKARTAALGQLGALIKTAPAGVREQSTSVPRWEQKQRSVGVSEFRSQHRSTRIGRRSSRCGAWPNVLVR